MRPCTVAALVSLVAGSTRAFAQPPARPGDTLVVVTVPLRHISSTEAMQLLNPYVVAAHNGGVFAVPNVRAVTIRESPTVLARMQKVLADYDRSPATISLQFQLVAADNSPTRDPSVASLDSLLRGVLRFTGYRLLGTAVASATEGDRVVQTISGYPDRLTLEVWVSQVRTEGGEGSAHLSVRVSKRVVQSANMTAKSATYGYEEILATGVTVPIGQTVVLGTAAEASGSKALILTVKPQIAAVRAR